MKLNFSDKARDMVASFMDLEEDGLQALRIAVSPFAPNTRAHPGGFRQP